MREKLAIFMATSGHSGVDRIAGNLIPAFAAGGYPVDLLHINGHGPYLQNPPGNVSVINLGTAHAYSSIRALAKYLKHSRPHTILSDKDRVNRVTLLAAKMARVPVRVVVRTGTTVTEDLRMRGPVSYLMHHLSMRHLYPWADAIVVPSRGAALDLAAFAEIPQEHIQVVPNPVVKPDLDLLAAAPVDHPWLVEEGPPIVLGAGELCARKDFATLLRAFAIMAHELPCRLLILGEGGQRQALLRLARELGIERKVSFPGFVSNPFAYMKKASLFVLSSVCEGFGNVLVEALSLGLPVVSTDCPSGPEEILMQGRYGRLVPVRHARALAEAMLATLADPPDRAFLQKAAQPYTVQASAEKYLEVLLGPRGSMTTNST